MTVTRADRRRLEEIIADRSAPQKHVWRANIILATADGAAPLRSCANRQIEARGVAMAGAVHGRGRRRAHPRQDPQACKPPLARHRAEGRRSDSRTATRRCNPLDRSDAGESGWREPAFGASILEAHRLAPHRVRTFKLSTDPKFARSSRILLVSTSIRPPMQLFCRSTRRAKSRRSTAPSRCFR